MSKKKGLILMLALFIITIVIINIIASVSNTRSNKITNEYFENLDLKVQGVICAVEEQTDTYKYLITLKNVKSNKNTYSKPSPLGAYFCITKGQLAVFTDHNDNYKIGDSISIGENSTDLIKCISKNGNTKFIKKRKEAMLYNIGNPNKKMIQLIKMGCK